MELMGGKSNLNYDRVLREREREKERQGLKSTKRVSKKEFGRELDSWLMIFNGKCFLQARNRTRIVIELKEAERKRETEGQNRLSIYEKGF